ncbi:MAG: metallophosphoesterase [Candidatus Bipolaricaulia bacterium]
MPKILHVADTHIGARQYGLAERRADFSRAFLQVVELAISERVSAVVHAGDLFDSRNPSTEDLQDAFMALLRLREAGIPFLGVVGNHEQKRGVQWLDLFASLGLAVHLCQEPYELDGVQFFGLDYSGRRAVELPRLELEAASHTARRRVLVAHQMLDRVGLVYGELKLSKLLEAHRDWGVELVLLGDYHEHRSWLEEDLLVTYPGSTERWRASERDSRGVSLIDLETKRLERRALQTRRFVYIGEGEDPLKGLAAQDLTGAVVCIYLEAHRSDSDSRRPKDLEEEALQRGALAVQFLQLSEPRATPQGEVRPPEAEGAGGLEVELEPQALEELLARALAELELSPRGRAIDSIIRDERIADSNVDPEVSKLLEG